MDNILKLDEKNLIAQGSERSCYIHPENTQKLIKVIYIKENDNEQNRVEEIYMNYLTQKKVDLTHLAKYYGKIKTIHGDALVYERIMDYDNNPSKSFRYYIAKELLSLSKQQELLNELRNYLKKNSILFIDTSLTNIFCKKIDKENYKLIIVDGLGAKRLGLKFWLYRHCKVYTKYKISRQWKKLISMYNKDIKRVKLGVRPITRV